MRVAAALAAAMLVFQAGHAKAESAGMGPGYLTCQEYNDDLKKQGGLIGLSYFTWAQGYMSGLNVMLISQKIAPVILSSMTTTEQMVAIGKWCDANPRKLYADSVFELFDRMRGPR